MNDPGRMLSAAAGYLVDVWSAARAASRHPHGYLKFLTLRALGRRTGARCLIETGTFRGVTSARSAKCFDRVVTIELDAGLACLAKNRLARYRNVTVLQGDAAALLPSVFVQYPCDGAIVFLDGHFSGGGTALGPLVEPAILELEILAKHADLIYGIVIDDFRLFGIEAGFPKKSELVLAVERLFPFPQFDFTVHFDQLIIERRLS
jgi:hypothetical protein